MSLWEFVKEKVLYITSLTLVSILNMCIIWVLNPRKSFQLPLLIGSIYIIGAAVPIIFEYATKREFYKDITCIFESLDKKNLIAEMISRPTFKEGIVLYDILKGSNKAMIEKINKYKFMQEEYREYIELWVHEVKTPISASKLIVQNNRNEVMDNICEEIDKIEDFVEQALFYSRSNTVEKDYLIKKVNLEELCFDVLKKNSKIFIHNKVRVETKNLDINVFTDVKWISFMLKQILTNSVKYMNKFEPNIKIIAYKMDNGVVLSVKDNGVGIKKSEFSRIFDKGFTGTNGRCDERSTGMGLYICKKLCTKLNLSIKAYSEYSEGTRVDIIFPKSSMMNVR
ncbi:sensor histidine kinase [Clostridium sp. KNHs214]|uniref:sensor histidine kinase n=1 Tax=Clostridium sp. KNHs214 TaxID=1540257 RepID=UPI00054FFB70|nr:sensor histidine kinase [Clostridium sp. KNHs214]